MRYLFVAEKPSLMREAKTCYEKHRNQIISQVGQIDFVSMAGHLLTNYMPDDYKEWSGLKWHEISYPMVPRQWGIKAIPDSRSKKLLKEIAGQVKNYDGYIVGTDADAEGYGIYYLLEQSLKLYDKPTLRFIERSLTDKELLESFLSMTDFHKDPVHIAFTESFLLRFRADWLYGMNLSRVMSVNTGEAMNIGRVKAPTIKLVYDNSMAIENFVPVTYFVLQAVYKEGFSSILVTKDGPRHFEKASDAPDVQKEGTVISINGETVSEHAPKLFDLAAIQAEASKKLKLSPERTLQVIQSLYETHKCISYPRTQCRYVSSEKAKEFPQFISQASVFPELAPFVPQIGDVSFIFKDKAVVNDKEVSKEAHDALLPTGTVPDIKKLSKEEYAVCLMVYQRMLAQFLPKLEVEKTQVQIQHGEHVFLAKGKIVKNAGWLQLYGQTKEAYLPPLKKGQTVHAEKIEPVKKITSPPKRMTQAKLLLAMMNIANLVKDDALRKSLAESKGIGTPATRSGLITEIINKGYVREDKKGLYITAKGRHYIETLEGMEIISPVFAAKLDMQIKKVQRRELDFAPAYQALLSDLQSVLGQARSVQSFSEYDCPCCGKKMAQDAYSLRCSCGASIGLRPCNVALSTEDIKAIVNGEKTGYKKFQSKAGKVFEAALVFDKNEKHPKFVFKEEYVMCPKCGENAKRNSGGIFCDACGYKFFRKIAGRVLSDAEIDDLLKFGKTRKLDGFLSKKGTSFSARLEMGDDLKISFVFD